MLVTDFNYNLPNELIAQSPATPRDHARLLVYNKETGAVEHKYFYDLVDYLNKDDLLVFNDTRVIPARLHGKKDTGAKVEVFLLSRINDTDWEALVKPGKKLKIGTIVEFSEELSCEITKYTDFGGRIVRFKFNGCFENILEKLGETPLPPYITTPLEDSELYQTVYSKQSGSAAAPTAGLHFTKEMLEKIEKIGIETAFVTLHVGLGTFRPVSEVNILDHQMHREFYSVSEEVANKINKARQDGRRIVAIGTTSVRTLESAGESGTIKAGGNWTEIFIYPGYKYRFVDALVTNFHLPQSTLLMLVAALSSREKILKAYEVAVAEKYRFFSFGDAMFIR